MRRAFFLFFMLSAAAFVGCAAPGPSASEVPAVQYLQKVSKETTDFDTQVYYRMPPLVSEYRGAGDVWGTLTYDLVLSKDKKTKELSKFIRVSTDYQGRSWHYFEAVSLVGGDRLVPPLEVTRGVVNCSSGNSTCEYRERFEVEVPAEKVSQLGTLRLNSRAANSWNFGFPPTYLEAFASLIASVESE